jgi:hypothetical protein
MRLHYPLSTNSVGLLLIYPNRGPATIHPKHPPWSYSFKTPLKNESFFSSPASPSAALELLEPERGSQWIECCTNIFSQASL